MKVCVRFLWSCWSFRLICSKLKGLTFTNSRVRLLQSDPRPQRYIRCIVVVVADSLCVLVCVCVCVQAGHSRPKPSALEMAMVSLCLSSFLVRYGGRQIWLKQVWEIGNLRRQRETLRWNYCLYIFICVSIHVQYLNLFLIRRTHDFIWRLCQDQKTFNAVCSFRVKTKVKCLIFDC